MTDSEEIFTFRDAKVIPDIIHSYSDDLAKGQVPIVIDNGSYFCRAGWATDSDPRLNFRNLLARLRREKGKTETEILIGNDIANLEAVRFQIKTPFDRDIITQVDTEEAILDYVFSHLGINSEEAITHPVVFTETIGNSNYSRQLMNELFFECYQVPAVALGVDALFSLQRNFSKATEPLPNALIVRLGYQTSHIIPVLHGRADSSGIRRLNLGGLQMISYMHRLLQLKYPAHSSALTFGRAEELLHDFGYITEDYENELCKYADAASYEKLVRKIQLPFTVAPAPAAGLTAEQLQRRKENVKKLVEINARKREERLAEDEERLDKLEMVQLQLFELEEEEAVQTLNEAGLSSEAELDQEINSLKERITRARNKMAAAAATAASVVATPEVEVETKKPEDTEEFHNWLEGIRRMRLEILSRRRDRQQRRAEMSKRKSAAAQERMRILSMLAKTGGSSGKKKEDTFGMRDEDWDIYKAVSKDGGSDSEAEQEKLNDLESVLKRYDPNFKNLGAGGVTPADQSANPQNTAELYQLHVATERIRAPEILFQPSLIGSDQAGIVETLDYILKLYDVQTQNLLVQRLFITGGCALFPGFVPRLERELRSIRPFESSFSVQRAKNPSLDAWYGARDFASKASNNLYTSKADYEEYGSDYFVEHSASNKRYALKTEP